MSRQSIVMKTLKLIFIQKGVCGYYPDSVGCAYCRKYRACYEELSKSPLTFVGCVVYYSVAFALILLFVLVVGMLSYYFQTN